MVIQRDSNPSKLWEKYIYVFRNFFKNGQKCLRADVQFSENQKPDILDNFPQRCNTCSIRFASEDELFIHSKRHFFSFYTKRLFPCEICGNVYESKEDLLVHESLNHVAKALSGEEINVEIIKDHQSDQLDNIDNPSHSPVNLNKDQAMEHVASPIKDMGINNIAPAKLANFRNNIIANNSISQAIPFQDNTNMNESSAQQLLFSNTETIESANQTPQQLDSNKQAVQVTNQTQKLSKTLQSPLKTSKLIGKLIQNGNTVEFLDTVDGVTDSSRFQTQNDVSKELSILNKKQHVSYTQDALNNSLLTTTIIEADSEELTAVKTSRLIGKLIQNGSTVEFLDTADDVTDNSNIQTQYDVSKEPSSLNKKQRVSHTQDTSNNSLLTTTIIEVDSEKSTAVLLYPCYDCNQILPSLEEMRQHRLLEHASNRNHSQDELKQSQSKCESNNQNFGQSIAMYSPINMEPDEQQNLDQPHSTESNSNNNSISSSVKNVVKQNNLFRNIASFRTNKQTIAKKKPGKRGPKVRSEEEDPRTCPDCGRRFGFPSVMKRHRLIHGDNRVFICDLCLNGFTNKKEMEQHMLTNHRNLRDWPYQCKECKNRFATKVSLKRHKIVYHTDPSTWPFHCCHCKKAFVVRGELERHMRKHTNERPFVCYVCHMRFKQSVHLINHQRSMNHEESDGEVSSETENHQEDSQEDQSEANDSQFEEGDQSEDENFQLEDEEQSVAENLLT